MGNDPNSQNRQRRQGVGDDSMLIAVVRLRGSCFRFFRRRKFAQEQRSRRSVGIGRDPDLGRPV